MIAEFKGQAVIQQPMEGDVTVSAQVVYRVLMKIPEIKPSKEKTLQGMS
jgi:hypothetical protein